MGEIAGSKGRRLQRRAQPKNAWTKAKRTKYLAVLLATCNAQAAARAVGKSEGTARDLRKRDGEFARLCQEALDGGYERLEQELLGRALGTVSSGNNPESLPEPAACAIDPVLGMRMLEMRARAGRGDAGPGRGLRNPGRVLSQAEVDHALISRLNTLAKQRGGA